MYISHYKTMLNLLMAAKVCPLEYPSRESFFNYKQKYNNPSDRWQQLWASWDNELKWSIYLRFLPFKNVMWIIYRVCLFRLYKYSDILCARRSTVISYTAGLFLMICQIFYRKMVYQNSWPYLRKSCEFICF